MDILCSIYYRNSKDTKYERAGYLYGKAIQERDVGYEEVVCVGDEYGDEYGKVRFGMLILVSTKLEVFVPQIPSRYLPTKMTVEEISIFIFFYSRGCFFFPSADVGKNLIVWNSHSAYLRYPLLWCLCVCVSGGGCPSETAWASRIKPRFPTRRSQHVSVYQRAREVWTEWCQGSRCAGSVAETWRSCGAPRHEPRDRSHVTWKGHSTV